MTGADTRRAAGVAVLLFAGFAAPAFAASGLQCSAQWDELSRTHQTGGLTRQAFTASCLSGRAPAATPIIDPPQNAPSSAAYRCRDGLYASTPAGCMAHRGVAARLR